MATFSSKTKKKEMLIEKNISLKEFITNHANSLDTVPSDLVDRIKEFEEEKSKIMEQTGRHKIRLLNDLERELKTLCQEREDHVNGVKKRRYLAESEKYLKEYNSTRDDNARGNISDSLVRLADTQTPFRYRKRSDLLRTIRMASLDKKSRGSEKHSIRDEFLGEFHGFAPPVYLAHGDICPFCNEQLKRETDFSLICQSCGVNMQIQDATSNAVSWNDDMDYVSFQYKRANHFCEWVNTSMAKQNCDVPIQVLRDCMNRLAREKVKPEQIDSIRIRQVLKELKLRKYYEHSLLISCRLTGKTPPRISPDQEEELRVMFAQMQEPFEQVREKLFPERKNFLSYSYILFKFCEILGLDEFKQNFQLLKGRDKLHKQDQIFRAICEKLNWSFTPSV